MRIKLCLIIPTLVQGGAEKQLTLLAQHLNPERFEVHVIVLTHSGPYEEVLRAAGIELHFIGKRGKFDPFAYRRLRRLLSDLKPHVVHTWLFAANSYGRMAAKSAGVPVCIAGERCVDPWKQGWQFAIDRRLMRHTDAIVTNTSAVTDFYRQHGIDSEKFTVIPNAVETPEVQRLSRRELCEMFNLPPRDRIVMAIGRLWKQKGYRDLIWAGQMVQVAYQDVWLLIVGDGPQRSQLQEYRDHVGAESGVRFLGHRSDATQLLASCDLLWNGSLYEGQSNTILEAMALGIPVAATDIPGTRDLVESGQTGLLYQLGDVNTLCRWTNAMLRDDTGRAKMGAAAVARVEEHFSLHQMIARHEELYLSLWQRYLERTPTSRVQE
ncbi:glycosyltransferase [Aureliella helgolandensis]|uniref:N-acetylgalactosamine-N, N'-diacetylbacillosaminyl-diphospho-undecaprenol 4-alpha-N-acetylgalactosaminyltransferase n=1 Tax=Aureliella helgolandensis TaxID=2527968 RepID=A0A518G7Z4_9BACT|nr:glycosyltransferase [Aureliella helgolandensis]QDV24707.1 N-acetylgalactosamine-N,N'-diacetylbacillosaminyl-diphospho-undecaprenol 4-alpha-N-acetylgalactosaminyltransferase [Aureliella helgolandensis]